MNLNENTASAEIAPGSASAQARDTSRREWLRHATTVAGVLAVGSFASRAVAQGDNSSAMGMSPSMTMSNGGQVGFRGAVNPAFSGSMQADGTVILPTDAEARAQLSIVPNRRKNPNHLIATIPEGAREATTSDVEILNFALGLEYLEADFYARVVAAHRARPYLPQRVFEVAQKLAYDEAAHVAAILELLRLGEDTPVAKPGFQFPSNVFVSPVAFLDLAATLEETGTGAYLGAAPKVDGENVLRFAASIYGIEARHTGLIRMLSGRTIAPTSNEVPLSADEVLTRVRPFIVAS